MNQSVVRKCNPDEIPEVKKLFETVFINVFRGHIPEFEKVTDGEDGAYVLLSYNMCKDSI